MHLARVAEVVPQLGWPVRARPGRPAERLHLGDVDRDRERAGPHHPAVDARSAVGDPARRAALAASWAKLCARRPALEADQVGAEHPAQQLGPAGQLHEQLRRRERDVQEEADPQVGPQLAEQRRAPAAGGSPAPRPSRPRSATSAVDLGEPPVDPLVGLPPAAVERRLSRPRRGRAATGSSWRSPRSSRVVVGGERRRPHPHAVDVGQAAPGRCRRPSRPRCGVSVGVAGAARWPARRGCGATRRRRPGAGAVVDGEAVGDDHQGALAHLGHSDRQWTTTRARSNRAVDGGSDATAVFLLTVSYTTVTPGVGLWCPGMRATVGRRECGCAS